MFRSRKVKVHPICISFTSGRLGLKITLINFRVCVTHAELFISVREWQNCQRDVPLENEILCVSHNFPCVIHAEMHVIWQALIQWLSVLQGKTKQMSMVKDNIAWHVFYR